MRLSIFGLGYVGAVTAGCLTELKHHVVGVDIDQDKVDAMNAGTPLIAEPGLASRIQAAIEAGLFEATTSSEQAVVDSEAALICVGTPSTRTGGLDDTFLKRVIAEIGAKLKSSEFDGRRFDVIVRSTCMPKTHQALQQILSDTSGRGLPEDVGYVVHPEFLREGTAVSDFFDPPKIVFGCAGEQTRAICERLYPEINAPMFFLDLNVAAMVKYADNCFHAAKVTFANEIGIICREQGISAVDVMSVFCQDTNLNISPRYLRPGNPFGGSCLPKDLRAMLDLARQSAVQTPMLRGIADSNREQIEALVARIVDRATGPIGVIGLAFKEHTDDLRESPSLAIVERLYGKGREVWIFDEYLSVREIYGANREFALQGIPHLESLFCDDLQTLVDHSQLLLAFHRMTPERLASLRFRPGQHVIDFTNSFAMDGVSVEGVYW